MAQHLPTEIGNVLQLCEQHLCEIVAVKSYEYASCYLWHDRPLYNDFGEQIKVLRGDTIYLHDKSLSPAHDLFHELGHLIGRKYSMVGNKENGYIGQWESENFRLIAQVSQQQHWSNYLNLFAMNQDDFKALAASEIWAELFMLWHLQPTMPEANLIDNAMANLADSPECIAIAKLAGIVRPVS